jgi:hypothetical protein
VQKWLKEQEEAETRRLDAEMEADRRRALEEYEERERRRVEEFKQGKKVIELQIEVRISWLDKPVANTRNPRATGLSEAGNLRRSGSQNTKNL